LTEGLAQVGNRDPVGPEVANSSDLGRLLCLGGERHGEENEEQAESVLPIIDGRVHAQGAIDAGC
jgi:hypothetical protein